METNTAYFHTLDVRNAFGADIEEIFSNEDIYDELGTEIYVISSPRQDSTTFPCIYVDIINPTTSTQYSSNTEIQGYSNFTVSFDIYSKELETYNKDDAVMRISEYLINGIQKKYHCLTLSLNQALPNIDATVSRWQVRFTGVMDNRDNLIYSN